MKQVLGWMLSVAVGISKKFRWVLLVYLASRLLAALVFVLVEGWTFLDAFWWSGVASLTIGYGDFFPRTMAGKLLADVFQIFWVLYVIPAFIAHMVRFVFKELNIFTHLEQEWLFLAVTRLYNLVRHLVQQLYDEAKRADLSMVQPPYMSDGVIQTLPPQPSDLDDGEEVVDEFDEGPHPSGSPLKGAVA